MNDHHILDLYWARSEAALSETASKYGRYCHCIAYNILHNDEDSEECVNDTYQKAWEALRIVQEKLDSKNFYAFNPAFDTGVIKDEGCGCE